MTGRPVRAPVLLAAFSVLADGGLAGFMAATLVVLVGSCCLDRRGVCGCGCVCVCGCGCVSGCFFLPPANAVVEATGRGDELVGIANLLTAADGVDGGSFGAVAVTRGTLLLRTDTGTTGPAVAERANATGRVGFKPTAERAARCTSGAVERRGVTVAAVLTASDCRGGVFKPALDAADGRVGVLPIATADGESRAERVIWPTSPRVPTAFRAELGGVKTATVAVGRLGVDITSLLNFFIGLVTVNEFSLSFSAASVASISRRRCKDASVPCM